MDPKNMIIYSDLDGTLLSYTSNGAIISEKNSSAINKWVELGGSFSIATGRNLKNILPLFDNTNLNLPMVLSNGALLYSYDTDNILYTDSLPLDFLREAIEFYQTHDYVALVLSDCRDIYTVKSESNKNRPSLNFLHQQLFVDEVMSKTILKASLVVSEENSERLFEAVKRFSSIDQINLSASSKRYMEIVSRNSSKGLGINKVISQCNLESKTLVCIGDYLNDIEMLEVADIPVAPLNGHESIKNIAKIITCHYHEGAVADLINRLLEY